MQMAIARWTDQVKGPLQALVERPIALLCLMLALNVVAYPYAGFTHDAMLYSAQVYNRAEAGFLANDLFFRYGSQDEYSLFSLMLTPAVKVFGIGWTFFIGYLASKALLLWGFLRVVVTLVKDRATAALALFLLAVLPVGHSAYGAFTVNEPFLTARLPACGLVLIGLARLLNGRPVSGLGLLGAAVLVHPLMAFPGLAVGLFWLTLEYLPRRFFWAITIIGIVALTVVLCYPPIGHQLLGTMDADWADLVGRFNPITFPEKWLPSEWGYVVEAGLIAAGWLAVLGRDRPREARLVLAAVVTGIVGLVATFTAEWARYTLLFQAQPYRALWLPQFLCIPLGIQLTVQLWQMGTLAPRLLAALIVQVLVGALQFQQAELVIYATVLLPVLLGCRGMDKAPRRPDWLAATLLVTFITGYLLWTIAKLAVVGLFTGVILQYREGLDLWRTAMVAVGPLVFVALGLAAVVRLARLRPAAQVALLAAAWLGISTVVFVVPRSPFYREHYLAYHRDLDFVANFLDSRRERGVTPTVYFSTYHLDHIWFELRANGYFNVYQMAGAIFSRDTTCEGARRAELAKLFELSRYRREMQLAPGAFQDSALKVFQSPLHSPAPTRADLLRLCCDRSLDYAVLAERFDGLYTATNGNVYVYDCARIRASIGSTDSPGARADAISQAAAGTPRLPRVQSPQRP